MKIHALGIDLGKTVFRSGRFGCKWAGGSTEAMFAHPTVGLHCEFTSAVDRHGGLQWSSLYWGGRYANKVMKCD